MTACIGSRRTHLYGSPDDFRRFVDRAHSLGMGVILDVVYNHLGPDGNYLGKVRSAIFSARRSTPTGARPSILTARIAGRCASFASRMPVIGSTNSIWTVCGWTPRRTFTTAPQDHILAAMAREARKPAAPREVIFVAENEPQEVKLVKAPEQGGYGLDGLMERRFPSQRDGGAHRPQRSLLHRLPGNAAGIHFILKYGYLYQGQCYKWQKKRRGTPGLDIHPAAFGHLHSESRSNRQLGVRQALSCSDFARQAARHHRTVAAGARHAHAVSRPGIRRLQPVPLFRRSQRRTRQANPRRAAPSFWRNSPAWPLPRCRSVSPTPADPATFERCKLDHSERETHREIYALHRDLLKLRRERAGVSRATAARRGRRGALLGSVSAALFRRRWRRPAVADEPRNRSASGSRAGASARSSGRFANGPFCGRVKIQSMAALERRRSTPLCATPVKLENSRARRRVLKPQSNRMNDLVIRMPWPGKDGRAPEAGLNCEWLVTNGLGGYASGTLSGVITRRYHGYLVAALPAPFGRVMMLNELAERTRVSRRPLRATERRRARRRPAEAAT